MGTRNNFIKGLPKAELHLHIEGSLEPEQMMMFAERNSIELPYKSADEIRAAYEFSNLQEFLDIYYLGMSVLLKRQDFYDLTFAYLQRAHADNCCHVEIFFDPQGHTGRGVEFADVVEGISVALADAEKEFDMSSRLIMCFLRHLSEEDAFTTLEQAEPFLDKIHGVGLDSSEVGHPPSKFRKVFAQSRAKGLKIVAHAGEEGPPEYVWEALDLLKIDRLDHGNRSMEDEELVKRLAAERMTLTVCPLSNLKLCLVDDLKEHPLRKMLQAGLKATVNSDDPSYFGGYINDNYIQTAEALDLTQGELAELARNSFTGAFVDRIRRAELLRSLDKYVSGQDGEDFARWPR